MTDLQALHDSTRTMVMGVLNITEDSVSDGGLWLDPAKAAQHGRDMMAAGADIIDIGAESTRPGAKRVSEADELVRITGAVKTLIPACLLYTSHTVGVETAQHIAGRGVQAKVAGGNQPLFIVLVQQFDRGLGMFGNELFDNRTGVVRRTVVHHQHLMRLSLIHILTA